MKTAAAVLFLVLAVKPAMAHHAFAAEFDAKKPIKIRGTVSRMEWINPHAWIHVDVMKPDGMVEEWMIEAGTPNTLLRRDITLPNGQTLFLGNADSDAPGGEKSK